MSKLRRMRLFLKLVWRKTGYFPPEEDGRISIRTAWEVAGTVWD